jgi:predicted GNAT family acetyltransferase
MSYSFGLSSTVKASLNQISIGLLTAERVRSTTPGKENSMTVVVNNKAEHRYELTVEGHLAATYYKIEDGVITFVHTEVPSELGGKGVGSALVKGALDQVRADGLKVIPECPFVKGYIGKHPEYADLLLSN